MFIEITFEEDHHNGENVINFLDYADRIGKKAHATIVWEDHLAHFAGCDVINLADRRH